MPKRQSDEILFQQTKKTKTNPRPQRHYQSPNLYGHPTKLFGLVKNTPVEGERMGKEGAELCCKNDSECVEDCMKYPPSKRDLGWGKIN